MFFKIFFILEKTDQIEEDLGEHSLMKVMKPSFDTALNVTTGHFFTNLSTTKEFQKHQITMIGTLHQIEKRLQK